MLKDGESRDAIASAAGVTAGQVSAIAAHVTMGTYDRSDAPVADEQLASDPQVYFETNRAESKENKNDLSPCTGLLIGTDDSTGELVFWNPFPAGGSTNPHVLIVGESGSGKTYTVQCLLVELSRLGLPCVIFDYGQGFTASQLPPAFTSAVETVEIAASASGIALNPFEIFPFDHHGPLNVAQRIADTFGRIYNIGVQQHAALRNAVVDTMAGAGITATDPKTWARPLPSFSRLKTVLEDHAADIENPQRRYAASVSAHISTVFVFNIFRQGGRRLNWADLTRRSGGVHVIQLRGLESSLERVVTELLLWNLTGYVESLGPGPLRCFIVLDEAHRLSFDLGSATERLLREGRKFGLGLILASQQAEDFSETAIANTATKLVFQITEQRNAFARRLCSKVAGSSVAEIRDKIQRLPRGHALYVHQNQGQSVKISSLEERQTINR